MQTHTKSPKKPMAGQTLLSTPDEAILAAADEPPPYGTVHVVGAIMFRILLFLFCGCWGGSI